VLQSEVLVPELLAVDGLTAGTVASSEVTTLEHELGDDTVEGSTLEVEGLAAAASTLLTGAESAEVLGGLSLLSVIVQGELPAFLDGGVMGSRKILR
jgi:hypothetical protein